jgi:two-component system, chemotaxis family, protein-glutamate methylesterase/glutaminase
VNTETASKIRVLVVDDAVVIRKILTDELAKDDEIEVIGTAPNGKIALQRVALNPPDIITLDLEMPEMDGLETLIHLKRDYPQIPVVMFSTLTERGGVATMEALARGASDYVTKPANVGQVTSSKEVVRDDLIRKIKALVAAKKATSPRRALLPPAVTAQRVFAPPTSAAVDLVVIGVSTGGPNALAKIIPLLPADLGVPVLIVQHMPPMFTRLLAERLRSQSKVGVVEAVDGSAIKAGTVYIAPGDFHLTIGGSRAEPISTLNQDAPENSCRPAVDVLFRSAANVFGAHVLAVVLTGMGCDGAEGCEAITQNGGSVIVQDRETSIVWGMPGAIVERGLTQRILPLDSIAPELTRRVRATPLRREGRK